MILKIRDFAGMVPRDFGETLRESILDSCVAFGQLASTRSVDEEKRLATFLFTDPSVDSYNEIIDSGAFTESLPQFMRNPIILPEHRRTVEAPHFPAVGHCVRTTELDDSLLGTVRFGEWPIGELRWQAVKAGTLRAVSVGFNPIEGQKSADGIYHYTRANLKEVSTVAIGANENALLVGLYVAGQLESEALRSRDTGHSQELSTAVSELRACVSSIVNTRRTINTQHLESDADGVSRRTNSIIDRIGQASRADSGKEHTYATY